MARHLAALGAGLLFGLGLAVSQMVNPAKILGFLDVAGHWDPSLALVMVGALAVALPGFRAVLGRSRPLLDEGFHVSTKRAAPDVRLLGGSLLFGIGWGLVGLCPGPAVASLAYGLPQSVYFLVAMAAGMAAARLVP